MDIYATGGFTYKISIPQLRPIDTNCEQLLGYAVDLDFPNADYTGSFYKFCRNIPELISPEARWYACYGHLVDQIQFGLAASNVTKVTFVAAYPLRICGWDHYLQLYFRRSDGRNATAKDLSDDLAGVGDFCDNRKENNLGMTILKECLREFLMQIRIAAFQGYVSDEIVGLETPLPKSEDEIARWVGEFFCKHAHNLVQVEWMRCADKWFGYPEPGADQTPMWRSIGEPQNARKRRGYHVVPVRRNPNIRALVPWEKHYTTKFRGALDPVFAGTSRQRLEEQLEWLMRRVINRQQAIRLLNKI